MTTTASQCTTTPDSEPVPVWSAARPDDVRAVRAWDRLAYITRRLPAAIEDLAGQLTVPRGGRVLDYGSADSPYRRLFDADVVFVTADLPGSPLASVHLLPDGRLPVDDNAFDAVVSTQVLEHVGDPRLYLSECVRVLRPRGRLLLSTHGMMLYHPDPVDLWRWTCEGLQRIVTDAGLEIERFEGIVGLGASGLQFFQDSALWHMPRVLRPAFTLGIQQLMRLVDRFEPGGRKAYNALVFGLVAVKP